MNEPTFITVSFEFFVIHLGYARNLCALTVEVLFQII